VKVWDSDISAGVRGQRKMSQVLGAFGLLDFSLLSLDAHFETYFFNFPIFFQATVNDR
jgi:hypothetical protein